MTILALDPGAKRLGWAVLRDGPTYVASGIEDSDKGPTEKYQEYRLRIMKKSGIWMEDMLLMYHPQVLVAEIVPVKGFNDMGQAYLALSVLTAIQTVAMSHSLEVKQIGATTVKSAIGGTGKATKVRVRNSVWQCFPELQKKAPLWKKVFDESDAIAVGLTHLGYKRPT